MWLTFLDKAGLRVPLRHFEVKLFLFVIRTKVSVDNVYDIVGGLLGLGLLLLAGEGGMVVDQLSIWLYFRRQFSEFYLILAPLQSDILTELWVFEVYLGGCRILTLPPTDTLELAVVLFALILLLPLEIG